MPQDKQKSIGIFFGSSTGNAENVATLIREQFTGYRVEINDTAHTPAGAVKDYERIIFGVSTWGIGDIQEDLAEFIGAMDPNHLSGKKIALYGLGDQGTYQESFVDALGKLFRFLSELDCIIVGQWPDKGYEFTSSEALHEGSFAGLVIDEDVQPEKTKERIKTWVKQLKKEFK